MQFHTKKHINLKLCFSKNKSYYERRTAHCYTVSSLLLKPLKQRLIDVTSFGLSKRFYFRSVLVKRTNNLVLFLQMVRIVEFSRPNFRHTSAFIFPFSIFLITLTFPSTLKTFLLFVPVAMLSLY